MTDKNLEVYKAVFDTWRYEVNSYWQRNSYFAAFETAAMAGCWYVVEHKYHWPGFVFSIAGLGSAVIWWITSIAVHRYVQHWWEGIKTIEGKFGLHEAGLDFASQHRGSGLHPSIFVLAIPLLFASAWIAILVVAICGLCSCAVH
jgi:hypothetical protein